MKFFLFIATFFLIQLYQAAHAEGGCPPGHYPQVGQGWRACVPAFDSTPVEPQEPRYPWIDQWQAIATDTPRGVLGTSSDRRSSKEAKKLAIANCEAKGGKECVVEMSVMNACLVMAVGDSIKYIQNGATKKLAEETALSKCSEIDSGCALYYSSCNFPIPL